MERLMRHPRTLAALQYTGYTLFFLAALVLSLPWTFPTRQLRTFVARQARLAGYPVKMDDIRLGALGRVEIAGLRLKLPGKPGEPGEGGAMGPAVPEVELKIDRISAKIAILPLLFGKTVDVWFDIEAGAGSIADGHVVQKGENIDINIGQINDLSLAELGIGRRALGPQTSLMGELDGKLDGKAQIHYGGSTDDLTGAVELELADAILKSPELSVMGGLKLTDLGVGTFTLKVKMNLKQNVAALAAQRGAEKATVIHIETLQAEGDQLELYTEEAAHILIPPGKGGFKQATIHLHFAFALPDKPIKKVAAKGDKEDDKGEGKVAEADKPVEDRAKWSQLLALAASKLKPFERGGFIGIGCTGPLARPQCKPEIPMVTTGTKGSARVEGGPLPAAGGPPPTAGAIPTVAAPEPAAPTAPEPNVQFRPAERPEAPPVPVPASPEPVAQPTPPPPPAAVQPTPGAEGNRPGETPPPEPREGRGERPPADQPAAEGRGDRNPEGRRGEPDEERPAKGDKGDKADKADKAEKGEGEEDKPKGRRGEEDE